jgi:lipopolysaccharide/colanic/teichoic acid biosynthesis glycosyltransferase
MEHAVNKNEIKTIATKGFTIATVDFKIYSRLLEAEIKNLKYNIVYIKNIKEVFSIPNLHSIIVGKKHTIAQKINRVKIYTIKEFYEKELGKIYIDNNDYTKEIKPYTKAQYFQKRAFDLIISIPLFILSLPIILYSAYRIKKESPDGNIFYTQTRVTQGGKTFQCYKLRSMRTDINYHSNTITENDPRLFEWGSFMRKTRIDEIPQLINVIKGDIHLIGPRAEWIKMVKLHEQSIQNYCLRHINKPGITGYAQVKCPYARDIKDTKEKFMHELYYIKNWNILFDLKIFLQTILVILGKKGK